MILPGTGIDLEFETDVKSISPDAAQYDTLYVTAHKGPCRAGAFHPKGMMTFAFNQTIYKLICKVFNFSTI